MTLRPVLLAAPLLLAALAGCANTFKPPEIPDGYQKMGFLGADPTGRNPDAWPSLKGHTVRVLDHGAFAAFGDAKKLFEKLTGATVVEVKAQDAGMALRQANDAAGRPDADVIYGIDNAVLYSAIENGTLEPYKPILASRLNASYIFFNATGPWYATPMDHGYVGINHDHANPENQKAGSRNAGTPALSRVPIRSLVDVQRNAGEFVTQSPHTSSPGWGFLIITVGRFGEDPNGYNWQRYWQDLFTDRIVSGDCSLNTCVKTGTVLVTQSWSEAYEQHFSGGYGAPRYGGSGKADRAIVTSYAHSPAVERFFRAPDNHPTEFPEALVEEPLSTWHQIETTAILRGTPNLVAAQAWVEFTLTDAFQQLMAPVNAMYPVVDGIDYTSTFANRDPAPGSFKAVEMDYEEIGRNLPRWLRQWTALCEKAAAANC